MNELLAPHDRPIPASYRLTGIAASVVVLICFATERWLPWFVEQMSSLVPQAAFGVVGGGLLLILGLCFAAPMVAAIWLAFRWPGFALALAVLPALVTWMDGNADKRVPFGAIAILGAVALTASWRRPWWSVGSVGLALVVVWWWLASDIGMAAPFESDIDLANTNRWAVGVLYTAVLLVLLGGCLLLRRSALREEQRRVLAARAGEVEEQSAVVEERARLARDLHDVVAHHVSLIAVRAETAPYTQHDLGESAKGLLGEIAADARLALDELRGVLGILGRAGESERSPQPTWTDITALVERTRAAGLDVTLEGDTTASVGPSVGYAAYRVVQEALTNARKHAPGAPVSVTLSATDRLVHVSVRNPLTSGSPSTGGRGLVGMKERVSALGGRMIVGVVDGAHVLEVTLPVVAS